VRFAVACAFTVIYWPLGAIFIFLLSVISTLFVHGKDRRALGQKTIGLLLGGYMNFLEALGLIIVHDDELKRNANMDGPLLIACNHPALWDAPLVIRRLLRVSCIMKAELLENPLLRHGALFAGFLPNAPRLTMVRKGVERLSEGGRLLLFPEGTRTRRENGLINPFRPGLALLAKQSGSPVLPVFISLNSCYLQKGWPIWRMPEFPILISIRVGDLHSAQPGERVRDFSLRLEEVFREGLNQRN
jgi:1-acyl-sn-glycerol-3-phosphate acyltransferase